MIKKILDYYKTVCAVVVAAVVLMAVGAALSRAATPGILSYQGRILVNNAPFGAPTPQTGLFYFALVDTNGTTTYWSNDNTSVGGSQPTAAVSLTVTNGLYSVLLGDTTIPNMTNTIPTNVFSNGTVKLRVWFNDGANGIKQLAPDQRLAPVGYAMTAAAVDAGAVTTGMIAPGAVTLAQIAPGTFKAPTVQKFTSGSGTYTTPTGVLYIRVRMVGGGGGGGGSSTTPANNAGSGGVGVNTSFGNALLVANGGAGGPFANNGGTGGTVSIGAGPLGNAVQGATGCAGGGNSTVYFAGGCGGSSPFGGAGGGSINATGNSAIINTGSGGGGAGNSIVSTGYTGAGGGAGGFIDALIYSLNSTYSYSIGSGGSGGTAGTNGYSGGAGGSGIIIVEEFYQ